MKNIQMEDFLNRRCMEYAKYTITDRAIVDLRDGCKPIHRRAIYSMYLDGLTYDKNRTKSAKACASVMRFSPHGDCLHGDTKVFLADGTIKTMKELYNSEKKCFDVISVDGKGEMSIINAHSFRIGQYSNKVYNIELSDGSKITVTGNHPLLTRDLKWIKAEDINENTLLYYANINIDFDNKSFRPAILSSSNKNKTLIQRLNFKNIDSREVVHHLNENINDNSNMNLVNLTRKEHAKIHKNNYIEGLNNGLSTMLEDAHNQAIIKDKNVELRQNVNKYMVLYKAYKVLDILKENGLEFTEDNYNNNKIRRVSPSLSIIYNWKEVNIRDFNHLVELYTCDFRPVKNMQIKCKNELKSYKKIKKQKGRDTESFLHKSQENKVFDVFDSIISSNQEITKNNYVKHRDVLIPRLGLGNGNINNRNYKKIENISNEFENLKSKYNKERIYVKRISIDNLKEEIPMYDFTVDGLENMMIVTNDNIYKNTINTICVHNSSIYQAMVRLANDSVNMKLIDGKGSFSSINLRDVQPGSSRYTEMRLAKITKDMLNGINKNCVDFKDNYDNSLKEPCVLPVSFPLILVNPNKGIAVGLASNICGYNFNELCENTVKVMLHEEPNVMYPDFSTGGFIVKNDKISEQVHNTGKGAFTLRGKYKFEKDSIIFTEIPYTTTVEQIEEEILKLIKSSSIKEIVDVNNYLGKDGLNLTIDLRKNTDKEVVINKLFKMTSLQSNFDCNFTVLHNGKPVVLGVKDILKYWCEFRIETARKSIQFDKTKLEKEVMSLKGLKNILLDIEKCIEIIRNSNTDNEVITNLKSKFNLNEQQSEFISNLKLRSISKNNIEKQLKKITDLEKKLNTLNILLNNENELRKVLSNQLLKLKDEYGYDRKSNIIELTECKKEIEELLIEDYNAVCYLTKDGYFKKVKSVANKGVNKIKNDDYVTTTVECSNKDELLIFAEDLNCYKYKLHEIEETKLSNYGLYIKNEIKNNVLGMSIISDKYKYVLITYKDGNIAKISLDSYKTKQNRQCLSKSLYNKDVLFIHTLEDDCDIEIKVSDGRIKTINTNELTINKSRSSSGKKIITWKNVSIESVNILNKSIDNKLV